MGGGNFIVDDLIISVARLTQKSSKTLKQQQQQQIQFSRGVLMNSISRKQ